jgi:ribonuclease BN (tRNA processing enzyme)
LAQLGIRLSTVQDVFLTHLHSDHVNGLSDFWLTSWDPDRWRSLCASESLWPIGYERHDAAPGTSSYG